MKKYIYKILLLMLLIFSCKEEAKKSDNKIIEPIKIETIDEDKIAEDIILKLPSNTIQLNQEKLEFPDVDIVLNKVQIVNSGENKFLAKIFFNTNQIDLYQNGNYTLFIQNYPYENNLELLDDNSKAKGLQSLSVNIKTAKKYNDEFVLFRSFESEIIDFDKIVVGFYDTINKKDLFRTQFNYATIKK